MRDARKTPKLFTVCFQSGTRRFVTEAFRWGESTHVSVREPQTYIGCGKNFTVFGLRTQFGRGHERRGKKKKKSSRVPTHLVCSRLFCLCFWIPQAAESLGRQTSFRVVLQETIFLSLPRSRPLPDRLHLTGLYIFSRYNPIFPRGVSETAPKPVRRLHNVVQLL